MLRFIGFVFCWAGGWFLLNAFIKSTHHVFFTVYGFGVSIAMFLSFVVAAAVANAMGK